MQDRWANLLANVLTEDSAEVRVAFPNILAELEPADATALDAVADRTSSEASDLQIPARRMRELRCRPNWS
jgi:hypothetical protein